MKEIRVVKRKEGKEKDFLKEVNNLQEQGYELKRTSLSDNSSKLAILTKHIDA